MTDDLKVEYTVKELLAQLQRSQDVGFAEVKASLTLLSATKADKSDLEAINLRLNDHGKEIGWLKDRQREDEAAAQALDASRDRRTDSKARRLNFVLSGLSVLAVTGGALAAVVH